MADNFKKLEEKNRAPDEMVNGIANRVSGNIGIIRFFMEWMDLFINKFIGVFISAAKDTSENHQSDDETTSPDFVVGNPPDSSFEIDEEEDIDEEDEDE